MAQVIEQHSIDLNNSGEANTLPNAIELNQEPHSKQQRKVV